MDLLRVVVKEDRGRGKGGGSARRRERGIGASVLFFVISGHHEDIKV